MIPTEILRRAGRKAKRYLRPSGPLGSSEATSPAHGAPAPVQRPAAFDAYTSPGDLTDLGVLFMPLAGYHGKELGAIADALVSLGHRCTFLVEEEFVVAVAPYLGDHPRILASPGYDRFALGTFDAFVAMNDWGDPSRAIYHLARVRGVPSFAKVEGVQDFTDVDTGRIRLAYLAADHVLVQGNNDIVALDRKNVHVVGNANMEAAWNEGPSAAARNGEVVINSNFTYGVLLDERDRFVAEAIQAVLDVGLTPVISQHPADRPLPAELASYLTSQSMSSMLPTCEAVVTRFSTVPFEAIAYGTPFVYFNPHFEKVHTFADPDPTFEHVHTSETLASALRSSIETRENYRSRAESYFRAQIDMTDTPSAQRAAEAIASVVYENPPT